MPEKIGKYHIVERIGRGGMGLVFKAHDPVLDRPVALKVMPTEVEVTDELRARFFREAQACARLSHPNIVTIYDMGEDGGQLFIVMELLDGEDLRHVIAERRLLPLETKLSIMMQVCEGLHYAHRKGIVHRDIKPGNIVLQRDGQVKVLDFGIAQMATTERGLTRTGLIMGTLRYIAPEQIRGRADARSDMFSVGAVFYEFLSFRPPFTGDDPIHLLEQLRADDPPALHTVDPAIPVELAAIVARALRKEPTERFADLEDMRTRIEEVHHRCTEEAQRIRSRLPERRDQLRDLQALLTERIGGEGPGEALPAFPDRGWLAEWQAIEHDLADRIDAARSEIARADDLEPAVRRGTELLEAGQHADAAAEFEAVVADMPDHARAADGLRRARAEIELERRRQLTAALVREAGAALEEGGYAFCLEILRQAADVPPPPEAAADLVRLRHAAEAGLAREEATRRARHEADRARERWVQARQGAEAQATPDYAPALWAEAEARAAGGHAAMAREAYAEALQAFEAATAVYSRFADAARAAQLREREAADQAREQLIQWRARAQESDAPHHAPQLWEAAETKAAEAPAVLARSRGRDLAGFRDAIALYRRGHEAAQEARARERQQAVEAEALRVEAQPQPRRVQPAPRQSADVAATSPAAASEAPDATRVIGTVRGEAVAATDRIEATPSAFARRGLERERATAAGRRADPSTGDERERRGISWARGMVVAAAGFAVIGLVIWYWPSRVMTPAPPPTRQATPEESRPLPPREARPPEPPPGREAAEALQKQVIVAREQAVRVDAERLAATEFAAARNRAQEGDAALGRQDMVAAQRWFREAIEGYGLATAEATRPTLPPGRQAGSRSVEREDARPGRAEPRADDAVRERTPDRTPTPRGDAAKAGREPERKVPGGPPAPTVASRPPDVAAATPERGATTRASQDVEQARVRMASARRAAEQSGAGFFAPKLFASAQSKEQDGTTAAGRADYASALRLLGEAQSEYQTATEQARREAEADRQIAPLRARMEQSRATTLARREAALAAAAGRLAKDLMEEAESKHEEADGLARRREFAAAAQTYQEAAERYAQATLRAQGAREGR